ncbi:MAG: hypothetical protein QNK04_00165 [Myxococcota bacterium]|nr:hypothetical protein [Myxococcota bacterium]
MPEMPRSPSPAFQPRFTLSLLYLFGFFLLYALLLAAPELSSVAPPADPSQDEAAKQALAEVVRHAVRPRLPIAFLGAIVTVLAGAHFGFLPGLRPR